ncbi:hypothetical protein ABZ820_22250 [Streptomyces diacarni]|uniref:hypothetical protein n=1 Tax=Streptomyces diacarni TaxID=2800381 RepID=UPI0033D034CE
MPDTDPCDDVPEPFKEDCGGGSGAPPGVPDGGGSEGSDCGGPASEWCKGGHSDGGGGLTDGASDHVKDLADSLLKTLEHLVAPGDTWAPEKADNWVYQQFLWLGQHLTAAIFICVVVVCALTAWQGAPRLKQVGASTGWALAAVVGMASVPGAVMLLNKAVSNAFTVMFDSNEDTLVGTIQKDLDKGADSGNPLAILVLISALVVALGFAALVFMTRQLGILAFVCMAPLVLASLARAGDTSAVKAWAQRLLGLILAPFALLLVSPFVKMAQGSLVVDSVLLVAADALMLRMIFHGVPYFGPKVARGARGFVESRTSNPLAQAVMRTGVPDVWEQENASRHRRTIDTPGRGMSKDRGVLFAAYGLPHHQRPGRMTTQSSVKRINEDAERRNRLIAARRDTRAGAAPASGPQQRRQPQTPPRSRSGPEPAAPPTPDRS